ncbi:MAG TPA: flagellar basal body-associated FliL family protein [Sphingobium sp.]|uniref:flagellar basal body-associated FliL family protein n=1 Tax=Sphingobium sp. TaxID=1912891 RepID=UPI002ED4F4A5
MSKDAEAPKKKGGGSKKLIIIIAAVALLGGGGAAAGFYVAGSMHKVAGPTIDPNMPRLVKKGEKPEDVAAKFAPPAEGGESSSEAEGVEVPEHAPVDLPRPKNTSAYQATYYQIPAPFTSNMADSDGFAQISIAVATYYDKRVIDAVQTHELAIRSAILMMLTQEQEMDLATPQGKERLQQKLVKIINGVLKDKTGYSGVDNVYFTNFVIQ